MNEFDENTLTLLEIGFAKIGNWLLDNGLPKINYLTDPAAVAIQNAKPALYAFIVDGKLKYLGKTSKILTGTNGRLYGYIRPGMTTATNRKCNTKITEHLNNNSDVIVLGFSPDTPLCYGEFKINLPAGLEDILIEKMNPCWNGRQPGTNKAETESATYEREVNPVLNMPREDIPTPPIGAPTFNIRLGQTYYKTGFINPGVDVDKFIGKHGEPILIYLGGVNQVPVPSIINRTANANGSARILSRAAVRDWFRANFNIGDEVRATIINPTTIILSNV